MSNKREATFHPMDPSEAGDLSFPEPERETIGDWAGHTPAEVMTSAETATEDVFTFSLEQKPDNIVTQQLLGLRPYILIKPALDEAGDTVINIEVGGSAELDGLGEVLEGIGKLLQEPESAQRIGAAIAAARAEAEQDYEDE